MKTHELKTWPEFFGPVESGAKPFECRYDDRGFAVGDILRLREWEPRRNPWSNELTGAYSGLECFRRVTHILSDYAGLKPGFVVLGITSYAFDRVCSVCQIHYWDCNPTSNFCGNQCLTRYMSETAQ